MVVSPDMQMWVTFAVIAAAVVSYALESISLEVTSVALVAAFLVFFQFFPVVGPDRANLLSAQALLSGFAHPALITILCFLVIGQGMFQTGALEGPTRWLADKSATAPQAALVASLLVAAMVSAFMNNTPVVVMFIPIIVAMSARLGMNASKTIMPLSFICILGGMTTLIGSSTNLLVAGVAGRYGMGEIGFFDFAVPGIVLASIGALYVLFVMPRLLVPRQSMADQVSGQSGKQFIAQLQITPDHPLAGAQARAGLFPELKNMTVRLIQRGEHPVLPPFEDLTLVPGDLVVVAATRKALTEALSGGTGLLATTPDDGETGDEEEADTQAQRKRQAELTMAEAVIAPGSRMLGRTIEQVGVRHETGCIVLGIQRRSRMIRMRLGDIRLEAGDVILVLGSRDNVEGLRRNRDMLLLEWSATELPEIAFAARARLIFLATVVAAASGLVPILIAAILGALAMIPAGCLNVRQAARAFDRRIYLLIGAAIAMATSLESTGGARTLAEGVVALFSGAHVAMVLAVLFLLIALMTNILSNHATAVLFTPIAINTATQLDADPLIFVFAVIFAANCSFATPMAYQTNLLVMGPGHYRFSDFMRAGVPLIFLIWLAYCVFAPWYYGLGW
jgi:di/tricarboxylate transporter